MSTALTTIFGDEIKFYDQPRLVEIVFSGYPGAHGVTAMNLGTRGKPFVITGKLWGTGNTYDLARAALDVKIAAIEALQLAEAADYTYHGQTYKQLQFIQFTKVPDGGGKAYHISQNGDVFVNFVMTGHILE